MENGVKQIADSKSFPQTLQEAIVYFANPDNALNFMIEIRWPDGISCPRCGSDQFTFISTCRTWQCKDKACKKMFTVKLGTVMEDSPIGLDKWLCAMWMICNAKNGVSSYEIHRAIKITQKSAWFLLHRIRLAMQQGSWTEVAVLVHLPKDDYKLSELKEAALQKAKEALSGLSEGGCVVSPPQTEVKRNQSQNP